MDDDPYMSYLFTTYNTKIESRKIVKRKKLHIVHTMWEQFIVDLIHLLSNFMT